MDFEGKWKRSFGTPERSGVWFIWGNSGNGKTRFSIQLAKYLTQFGKVAYNPLEEGISESIKIAMLQCGMDEVSGKFILLNRENMEEIKERLAHPKGPQIIIIDSFQYTGMSKIDYIKLKEQFPHKLFIFISHAEGKLPEGRAAKFVRYDAGVKIWVEGYKAFPTTRYGGGEDFLIWEQEAQKIWGL